MSAPAPQRIGLGTAQFGLDYGITNSGGRVAEEEVRSILAAAAASGMDTLDTAYLYGESEAVLGRCLDARSPLRIVTKTAKFRNQPGAPGLIEAFTESLRRLGRERVHALLFHDAGDLLGPSGDALWQLAERLQAEGGVEKIGLSVYEPAEIDEALRRYPIGIVQLPWNPLDPRLADGGQLQRLASAGVEVHARSLFLQGLLLAPVDGFPDGFGPLRAAVGELAEAARSSGLTRLEALLALAFSRPEIDRFVCGVTSCAELQAIVLAAEKAEALRGRFSFAPSRALDPLFLNPARWPELTGGKA
jgi:aryl-alcohol dehydrogenase-like predicted oxidoreductase